MVAATKERQEIGEESEASLLLTMSPTTFHILSSKKRRGNGGLGYCMTGSDMGLYGEFDTACKLRKHTFLKSSRTRAHRKFLLWEGCLIRNRYQDHYDTNTCGRCSRSAQLEHGEKSQVVCRLQSPKREAEGTSE